MSEENSLHEYQIKELLETQEDHSRRIKSLEENRIEMRMEFSNIKKELSDQKALTLDLDRQSREKNDKLFEKMLSSQDAIMNKLVDSGTEKVKTEGKVKLKKVITYGGIILALISSLTSIILALLNN